MVEIVGADNPARTVTFLVADVEGPTRLPEAALRSVSAALDGQDTIVRQEIEEHGGRCFTTDVAELPSPARSHRGRR